MDPEDFDVRRGTLKALLFGAGAVAAGKVAASGPVEGAGHKGDGGAATVSDVLIVGAGTAGIPAAIAAADLGAKVTLIDKNPAIGGELHASGGTMTGAQTILQLQRNIEDSPDLHYRDCMKLGAFGQDPELLRLQVNSAPAMIDWLYGLGVAFTPTSPELVQFYPWSVPRTHWAVDNARGVLKVLRPELEKRVKRGDVTVHVDTRALELLKDGRGRIIGVLARTSSGENLRYLAKSILLTTGGYARNVEMIRKYSPNGVNSICGALPHTTGDGLLMAEAAGAQLHNMDRFVPGPSRLVDAGGEESIGVTWPPTHYTAAILVNLEGRRYISEDDDRFEERVLRFNEQPNGTVFYIFDETIRRELPPMVARAGFHPSSDDEALERQIALGVNVRQAATIRDLANTFGIDADGLQQTVDTYNRDVVLGRDIRFRRRVLRRIATPPFYALRIYGSHLVTYGGIKINTSFQALDVNERVIPGLYVAGEAIGAAITMGHLVVGGMTFTPALTFGRLAGRQTARDALAKGPPAV
jgi:fumarate reductase flavoprotein subunit